MGQKDTRYHFGDCGQIDKIHVLPTEEDGYYDGQDVPIVSDRDNRFLKALNQFESGFGYQYEFQYSLTPTYRWLDGAYKPKFGGYSKGLCIRF